MDASGQVLAGVRRAPAHGAVLLIRCHRPFHPGISKPLAGRGLFSHQGPWGWGRTTSSCFPEGVCLEDRALAREPGGLRHLGSHLLSPGLSFPS